MTGDTTSLIGRVILEAQQGQRKSLRDLATLVDDPKFSSRAREALIDLTIFQDDVDVETASRQQLLDYYYTYRTQLRWSDLLHVYYRTPIEQQETEYNLVSLDAYQLSDRSMHLRKYIDYVNEAVEYKSPEDLQSLVEKIADLKLMEGQAFLLGLLDGEAGELLARDPDAFLHYLDQLLARPSIEVADALFKSEKRGYLRDGTLAYYLSRLCNVPFRAKWSAAEHRQRYRGLMDSLGGLMRVRDFGYQSNVPFERGHFREAVDYYGRVLAKADLPAYVQHNALLDLVDTKHPRALFYLSTQLRAARRGQPTAYHAVHYLYALRKITRLGVLIPDGEGKMAYQLDVAGDRAALLNFVRYWAAHYEDYDWDEHRHNFVNRYDHTLETENLERLFRLLNSQNDEVALQAYERIARADPLEVEQLVNKYKDLLRSTNPKVPPLKDDHLQYTAQLTAFCVRNRVKFDPDDRLAASLDSLLLPLKEQQRVALENQLISKLTLEQLTAVEYWALIHQYSLEAGYSIGRILDYSYSKHWEVLLQGNTQLRLYFKKSMLFARMDGIGISEGYLRKFTTVDADLRERLKDLLLSESDKHITKAIKRILKEDQGEDAMRDLDDFLERPERFSREEIRALRKPTLEQLSELMWRLEDPTPKAKFLYKLYLDHNLSIALVPDLMSLLMRDESSRAVGRLISEVYHYKFEGQEGELSELWFEYWRENSASYQTWGKEFYARHKSHLGELEAVTGADLNSLLGSPDYQPRDRKLVLEALTRLKSNRHLFMLKFEPSLKWEEREVLSSLNLKYRDLQDLDKLFPDVPPAILANYILAEAENLDDEERGKLFNALMRKPWIDDLMDDPTFRVRAEEIGNALAWYMEGSSLLSEYEEQNTALNLARLKFIGKAAHERLKMSTQLDVDEAAKLRIQESILARVQYKELPGIMPLMAQLADVNGKRPYNFISQDFGLPIFELESNTVLDTFVSRYQRLSELELYTAYLEEFGVSIQYSDGTLNYDVIADVLRYDIVLPFIGGGGNRRDLYTYGVIKLLELSHGTRLGFHEKLNENQLFYSFSASRRALAWLDYLRTNKLYQPAAQGDMPSFNTFTIN